MLDGNLALKDEFPSDSPEWGAVPLVESPAVETAATEPELADQAELFVTSKADTEPAQKTTDQFSLKELLAKYPEHTWVIQDALNQYRIKPQLLSGPALLSGESLSSLKSIRRIIRSYRQLTYEEQRSLSLDIIGGREAYDYLKSPEAVRLTPTQEEMLQTAVQSATQAYYVFLYTNLALVMWVTNKFVNAREANRVGGDPKLEALDFFQEGMFGLMRAIEKYDGDRGKFSTYAVRWIKQKIGLYISQTDPMVGIPTQKQGNVKRMWKVSAKLERQLGRPPTDGELAQALGVDNKTIGELDRLAGLMFSDSLNVPISDDPSDGERMEFLADPTSGLAYEQFERRQDAHREFHVLAAAADLSVAEMFVLTTLSGVVFPGMNDATYQNLQGDRLPLKYSDLLRVLAKMDFPLDNQFAGQILGVSREMIRLRKEKAQTKIRAVPERVVEMKQAAERLKVNLGRTPTRVEIAQVLNVDTITLTYLQRAEQALGEYQ